MQLAQVIGQGGLVSNRRGDASQEGRNLGAGLGKAEDVVDEQKYVFAFFVAEVLRNGQGGQGHPRAGTRRFVHLSVNQGRLFKYAGFLHFQPQIVALAGSFADAAEDGQTAVLPGHVLNQFHDNDGFADARAAEEADLAALHVGLEQVDDLDAGLEHLNVHALIGEGRRFSMDGIMVLGTDGAHLVHGSAHDVDDAAQGLAAHGHLDGVARVRHRHAPHQAVRGIHGDTAGRVFAQVLRHFDDEVVGLVIDGRVGHRQGIVNVRHLARRKNYVHHGADDLSDAADGFGCFSHDIAPCDLAFEGLGAAHDFHEFGGDGGLPSLVVLQR